MSTASFAFGQVHLEHGGDGSRQPLSRAERIGLLVLVISIHIAAGWALTLISPTKLVVGEGTPMEVRIVAAEPAAPAESQVPPPPDDTPPPQPPIETMVPPPPDDPLPPQPPVETILKPPPPDLPPPEFPVQAKPPPPPPKPRPPVQQVKSQPTPQPATPAAPAAATPSPIPAAPSGPISVSPSEIAYLTPPNPIYPARSRRDGEKGTVMVSVLIDTSGRPVQVAVQASSGHALLDESALSAVRAARFKPISRSGAQAVSVTIPINFVLH
jgi:periplasmic protein TonB